MGRFYSQIMKPIILVNLITWFFIFLFVYTGVVKLSEVHLFREQLLSSPFLGPFAGIFNWALPIGEILLAIALFIPRFELKALYATLILMSLFTIYVIVIYFFDSHLSCSCGGIIEELTPKQHILFNTSCVFLSTLAIAMRKRNAPSNRFQWFTGSSAIVLFLLLGWTLFTAFTAPTTVKTGLEGRQIPAVDLLMVDSTTHLNTANIPSGQPLIVIGFSPWCVHCQAMTRDIIKNIDQFKNLRIYYITTYPFEQMKTFYVYFKLARFHNIYMGRDVNDKFLNYFKAPGVPYTMIFDPKKRVKMVMNGQYNAVRLAQLAAE